MAIDEYFFMYLEGDLFPVYFILNIYVDMYNRRDRIIPRLLILLLILNAILLNSLPQFLTILSSFHTSLHKTIWSHYCRVAASGYGHDEEFQCAKYHNNYCFIILILISAYSASPLYTSNSLVEKRFWIISNWFFAAFRWHW